MAITFESEQRYRRRDLHERYGGQQQGGISTPARHPIIFLFTGESGEQFGYRDSWTSDGRFRYSGEGQVGDMTFARGNAGIRDHESKGKYLHLLENAGNGFVTYVGQMMVVRHELVKGVPDRVGTPRTVIVFHLART